jgi:hypothetical protein
MKIYDIQKNDGQVFAFEISSSISRKSLCKTIAAISGAKLIKQRSLIGDIRGEEEVCEFELNDEIFIVSEPFGDNSRYWIGPKSLKWNANTELVRDMFIHAKKFLWFVYGLK